MNQKSSNITILRGCRPCSFLNLDNMECVMSDEWRGTYMYLDSYVHEFLLETMSWVRDSAVTFSYLVGLQTVDKLFCFVCLDATLSNYLNFQLYLTTHTLRKYHHVHSLSIIQHDWTSSLYPLQHQRAKSKFRCMSAFSSSYFYAI